MYRFDPRRHTIAFHGSNSPNPHGTAFDNWGYQYATDGTGGRSYQVRPDGKSWKMHMLLTKEVRPVPACEILSSSNFPDDMQGDFLICNSIGFLGIKQYTPTAIIAFRIKPLFHFESCKGPRHGTFKGLTITILQCKFGNLKIR